MRGLSVAEAVRVMGVAGGGARIGRRGLLFQPMRLLPLAFVVDVVRPDLFGASTASTRLSSRPRKILSVN
jgi:hypothetical protein